MTRATPPAALPGALAGGGASPGRVAWLVWAPLVLADALAASLAATPWLRAYDVAHAPLLLALAAGLPVPVAAVTTGWLRFRPLSSYGVSAIALATLLACASSFDLHSLWVGAIRVPAELLTEILPLGGGPYLLVAPMVVTWVASAASAEVLLRPLRPAAVGLAVPLGSFLFAFAATTSAPQGEEIPASAALLGATALSALARQAVLSHGLARAQAFSAPSATPRASQPGRHRLPWRPAVATLGAAGLAAALAYVVPAVPALASRPAVLARPSQLLSGTVVDPVSAMAALSQARVKGKPFDVLSVSTNRPWSGYVAVAILDDYDGGSWSFTSTFRPTGGRVPPGPGAAGPAPPGTSLLSQRYVLEHPIGLPFLPQVDRPAQVGGPALEVDATTGMLAAQDRAPLAYSVLSQAPELTLPELPSGAELATGSSVPGGQQPAYTSLPLGSAKDIAAAVRFAVNLTGAPPTASLTFLQDLAGALRDRERRLSLSPAQPRSVPKSPARQPSAPPPLTGTSLAQVINAVTVYQAATPEQFATFFAAVARYLGVPVRLVTGLRVPAAARRAAPLGAGTYNLTNTDAWTWDEIPVAGYGWVVADPTPLATTSNVSAPAEPVRAATPSKPNQATAQPSAQAAHALAPRVGLPNHRRATMDWAVWLGAGLPVAAVLAALAGLFGLPAARRRLRRLARYRPDDPAWLAAGAWLELLDGLGRLGLALPPSATSSEVVSQVASHFGEAAAPPARFVASVADQALYCTRWPLDEHWARLGWSTQQRLCRDLRQSVGRRRRLRSLVLVGTAAPHPGTARPTGRKARGGGSPGAQLPGPGDRLSAYRPSAYDRPSAHRPRPGEGRR